MEMQARLFSMHIAMVLFIISLPTVSWFYLHRSLPMYCVIYYSQVVTKDNNILAGTRVWFHFFYCKAFRLFTVYINYLTIKKKIAPRRWWFWHKSTSRSKRVETLYQLLTIILPPRTFGASHLVNLLSETCCLGHASDEIGVRCAER